MEITKDEDLSVYNFKAEADLEKVGLTIIDFGLFGDSDKKIIETIDENFKFVNMENGLTVKRELMFSEIDENRKNNLDIVENKLPEYEEKFAEIELKAKQMIKDAREELNSYKSQSKELAREIVENSKGVQIKKGDVYRIAHNKHFIYLTVNNGLAIPIKVEEIKTKDLQKWDNGVNEKKSFAFFGQTEELKEAK